MKKVISYLLIVMMMFSLMACGSESSDNEKSKDTNEKGNKVEKEEAIDTVDLLVKVLENFDDLKYVDAALTVDVEGEQDGEKSKVEASLELAIANFLQEGMQASAPF